MSKGAYYQGLVYANKGVKPVNFGALATGVAEQELTKRKDREEFELKIAENYGDVIYPAFDGTGLENADMYQRSVADLISARAEDLNDRFNNKEINKVQYTREMAKLKGQTQELVSSFGKVETFVEEINKLGKDADPSSLKMAEELDLLFKNATPYLNDKNGLGNFSVDEEGKNVSSFLWSKVNKRLFAESRYDVDTIPKTVLGVQGELSEFFEGKSVIKTFLNNKGELRLEQAGIISNLVDSMSDTELSSYAIQTGIRENTFSKKDITELEDKTKLKAEIKESIKERTKSFLQQKKSTNDVAYRDYSIKLRDLALREDKAGPKDTRLYDKSYTDKDTAKTYGYGTDFFDYTFSKPTKVKGLTISGYKIPVPRENAPFRDPIVVGYRVTGDGRHFAKISHNIKTPIMRELPNGQKAPTGEFTEEERISYVPLQDKMEINQIRSIYKIPILTDEEPADSETKTNSNSSKGILD